MRESHGIIESHRMISCNDIIKSHAIESHCILELHKSHGMIECMSYMP